VTGTGRLAAEIGLRTQRVIYGTPSSAELAAELGYQTQVDQAHVLMLLDRELTTPAVARALLGCIDELRTKGYRQLLDLPTPRGLYLMYEGYLITELGPDIGGVLHTGRSRNDLKATMTLLRLRDWLIEFGAQLIRLEAVLLNRARVHRSVLMPVYTHFQAAMPISYGYYLLGIAQALARDVDALRAAADGLLSSPLGAGAVAGSDLPIDPALTAELLGFARSNPHALDAVASRDVALRLLAAAATVAITLSRLAADLQLWSSVEFGFVTFPDRLVGGSSAMPQKRNAFLLEHVKAKPALAIGAWTASAAAMSATPFTNSIEVGTEAMAGIWPGLAASSDSVLLCQVLVSGARPVAGRMRIRAEEGFTGATAIANQLVRQGVPFRTAHEAVGSAVRQAVATGSTDLANCGQPGWLAGIDPASIEVGALLQAQRYGGGPGAFDAAFDGAAKAWGEHRDWLAGWRQRLNEATGRREQAVLQLLGGAS
jgi:argininosuccinate lyase